MLAMLGHMTAMLSHRLVKVTALSSMLATWSYVLAIMAHMKATLGHR